MRRTLAPWLATLVLSLGCSSSGGQTEGCAAGSTLACYSGPEGTEGVGACSPGAQTCSGDGYGACVSEVTPVLELCGNETDDDCDGQVDEGCDCVPGDKLTCYGGPRNTAGVGACKAGTQTCKSSGSGYAACAGETKPSREICGNDSDDDCDGETDEGCVCVPGSTIACYSGPEGTEDVGACRSGRQTCESDGNDYDACSGEVKPVDEVCGNEADDDCNGEVDDGCECSPGASVACYSGPENTDGVGACSPGTKTCDEDGHGYGACSGEVTPVTEVCGNEVDDDCDGPVDEGCVCVPASTDSCYSGPENTEGVGACSAGTKTCDGDGNGYGACSGDVTPVTEVCGNDVDDDCDGPVDEGCVCEPTTTASCYSGPENTSGVGKCKSGTKTCDADGNGYGACSGEVTPIDEVCGNNLDDDCDGPADEGCICAPSSSTSCYTGAAGTAGIGLCKSGTKTCNSAGTAYGACIGQVTQVTEICGNTKDDDCDGNIDEGCLGDRVWIDADKDGIQDPGEAGLGGTIFLLRTSSGALVSVTTSDSSGAYMFSNVPTGNYYVEVIPPFNYKLTVKDVGGNDALDNDCDPETSNSDVFTFSGLGAKDDLDAGFYLAFGG